MVVVVVEVMVEVEVMAEVMAEVEVGASRRREALEFDLI
jgi:hypothetical protein